MASFSHSASCSRAEAAETRIVSRRPAARRPAALGRLPGRHLRRWPRVGMPDRRRRRVLLPASCRHAHVPDAMLVPRSCCRCLLARLSARRRHRCRARAVGCSAPRPSPSPVAASAVGGVASAAGDSGRRMPGSAACGAPCGASAGDHGLPSPSLVVGAASVVAACPGARRGRRVPWPRPAVVWQAPPSPSACGLVWCGRTCRV